MELFRWQNVVDFLVLASALYVVLRWANKARALRIALTILGLHIGSLLARQLDLVFTSWILDGCAVIAAVLLLFAFRAELRHALMGLESLLLPRSRAYLTQTSRMLADGLFALARQRLGGLVVIVRRDSVDELIDGGVELGSQVSAELLEAVFQKTSPLHDGAVVIESDRLVKANMVLPLTERREVPEHYGTRHRAAMGLAERCDALVVVVSEERGEVTLMDGRAIRTLSGPEELVFLLQKLQTSAAAGRKTRLRRLFLSNLGYKFAALGLAGLIWSGSFFSTGTTIRTVGVPVEFDNVPAGLEISSQSADVLDVQVRGSSWLINSVSLTRLVAHFDLHGSQAGVQSLTVQPDTVQLPPGMLIERISPERITVKLGKRSRPRGTAAP